MSEVDGMLTETQVPAVGFVGLGVIGGALAAHLASGSDRSVLGYDVAAAPREAARSRGVEIVPDLSELAERANVVFLSLPGAAEVEAVCNAPADLLERLRPGSTLVDMSTVPIALTQRIAARAEHLGIAFVDAPIAATAQSVQARQASFMVGAEPEVFARVEPLLACMAEHVLHCGSVGSGGTAKLLLNAVVAQTGVAIAETLTLARRTGVGGEKLFEALARGCDSFVLQHHGLNALLPNDFPEGRFSARYMLKDLEYGLSLAEDCKVRLAGTEVAVEWLRAAVQAGDGDAYWPVLVRQIEQGSGR